MFFNSLRFSLKLYLVLQSASKRKCPKEQEEADVDSIEPPAKKSKTKKETKHKKKKDKETVKSADFKIADQQTNSDSDNDLYSNTDNTKSLEKINVEAWSSMGVPVAVIKALADQNFHSPTMIQTRTMPAAILGRRDILGAAETGSGKTLAFGIPIIKGILDLKSQNEGQILPEKETEGSNFFFCLNLFSPFLK